MIRVLHVIGKMDCGGAETLLMNLYRNIDRSKIQFDFMVHTSEKGFYDEEIIKLGGKIYTAPTFNVVNILQYSRFWKKFYQTHSEHLIIHGHINSSAAIYLNEAKKQGRIAVVHSHNTKTKEKNLRALAFNAFSYPIRHIADYFFGCSYQAGIDRFGKKIADSNRFQVLNNGIDASLYIYNPSIRYTMRERLNINENTTVIGHVGRFAPQKNHFFLLKIFESYHKINKNSELWLIGKGELEKEIRKKVKEFDLLKSVKFFGVTDCVQEYLQAMDVFVFPSIYEGLGIAVVEAQAAGLPCIVSEAIVPEADIGAGLMKHNNLSDSLLLWNKSIDESLDQKRKNTFNYVINAGYDIKAISTYLSQFYFNILKKAG